MENIKEELKIFIVLCLDMIDLSSDRKTIIFFENELKKLSERYKKLLNTEE